MTCPRCNSTNVHVQVVQDSATTRTRGPGCLWRICRLFLIICTCGLWLLIGRRRAKSRTYFSSHNEAVCQNCGCSWRV